MASFGRRPAKSGDIRSVPVSGRQESNTFLRMKEEEAEREKWAKDAARSVSRSPSKEPSPPRKQRKNPHVFFEIEIRGKLDAKLKASGRLEFELFADSVPKTAENIRCLCTGEKGKALHYENSKFHRIIPGLIAQGGDVKFGDGGGADGSSSSSGRSIYGDTFDDESFSQRHTGRGILSMANSGPNSNNSQFMILLGSAAQFDRKHVVVGKMTKEQDEILRAMEKCGSKSGSVQSMVCIVGCGEVGVSARPRRASRSRSRDRGGKGSKGGPDKRRGRYMGGY